MPHRSYILRALLAASLAWSLAACEGEDVDDPLDAADIGPDMASGGEGEGEAVPFDDDEAPAFLTANCAGCHIGGGVSAGLSLDDVVSLIGEPSSRADIPLIDPEAPDNSYIWMKMAGDGISGARMPLRRTPIDPDDLAAFAGWIAGL